MTTTQLRWTNPIKLPDGHRLFQAATPFPFSSEGIPTGLLFNKRGMWAMADDSGHYPDDTDDGLLWLNFWRDLRAGTPVTNVSEGVTPGIPLLDVRGTDCSTITDTATLLTLAVKFDWRINCLGTALKVREA